MRESMFCNESLKDRGSVCLEYLYHVIEKAAFLTWSLLVSIFTSIPY